MYHARSAAVEPFAAGGGNVISRSATNDISLQKKIEVKEVFHEPVGISTSVGAESLVE